MGHFGSGTFGSGTFSDPDFIFDNPHGTFGWANFGRGWLDASDGIRHNIIITPSVKELAVLPDVRELVCAVSAVEVYVVSHGAEEAV